MFFVFPYGVITDMDKPPFMNHFLGMVSIESCCCMIYRGVCLQDVHIHIYIYIYLVIDLKVLVRSFNCESRVCYVGNPRESFFRVRESKISFRENFAKIGYYNDYM